MNTNVLNNYTIKSDESENNTFIIKGAVQSGKTKTLLAHALASSVCGMRNVIIVRNISEDKAQILNSTTRYTKEHKHDLEHTIFKDSASLESTDMNGIVKWMNPTSQIKTLVLLANGAQLKEFNEGAAGIPYNLFIDEADQALESEQSKTAEKSFARELLTTINGSTKLFAISATTFSLLFKENFSNTLNTLFVNTPDNYHGVEFLAHQEINQEKIEGHEYVMESHPGLRDAIFSLNRKVAPRSGQGLTEKHPHILLAKISQKTDDHTNIVDFVLTETRSKKRWATIVYNGQGIEIGHHSFKDEEMKIDDVTGIHRLNNCYTFKGLGVQAALSFLKRNGGVTRFSHIIIAAGKLADRGINFVSGDYQWSITDQYLHMSESANASQYIQSLRILGCHSDNMSRTLWSTSKTWDNIKKYHKLDADVIEAGKKQNVVWSDFLRTIRVHKERLPSIKLSKRKTGLKAVVKETNDNLLSVEMVFGGDSVEREGLERVKNAWDSKRGIIYKIIKLYVDNDFKSMSKKELDTCGGSTTNIRLNIKHYSEWIGTSNGRVNIIQKINGNYILRSEIISLLNLL